MRQGQKSDLTPAEARQELELLEKETQAGNAVTVSLAWQIVVGGGEA